MSVQQDSADSVDPSSYAISIFGRHDKNGDGSLNRTVELLWTCCYFALPSCAPHGSGCTFRTLEAASAALEPHSRRREASMSAGPISEHPQVLKRWETVPHSHDYRRRRL